MAAESICDACGKREPMEHNGRDWFKPRHWYERSDEDGVQTACSRDCIQKVASKSGKTNVVLPI